MEKLLAYCTYCGSPQGTFDDDEELRLKIVKQKKCGSCGTEFSFTKDGRIWNLAWDIVESNVASSNFWSTIHNSIVSVAKKRFEDGHYADAVESAFKEVNNRVKGIVKTKIGKELDGADLMNNAFSINNPIISLDDLSSETGKNIQNGYMSIFAGAMTGIRNPKAHGNLTISVERATHFIFLASLLMYKLDEAK
jgi:uncharacterized protein (TIGR02391 family)